MERGKYIRKGEIGASYLQESILGRIQTCNKPITVREMMSALEIKDNFSNKISVTRSFARMRKRGLLKSIGRNPDREFLWILSK